MISLEKTNKVCAVIPIFNEIEYLDKLIPEVHKYVDRIICVDDGSTDGSSELLNKFDYVNIISHEENLGKGKALFSGLSESIRLQSKITITIDADGQHDPSLIPLFIKNHSGYDMLIGNRMSDLTNMPLLRIASNRITSWLLTKKTGIKIYDSQSGFRSFNTNILKHILPSSNGFEAETEMLIKASILNYRIGSVKISTIYNNNTSKIKAVKTILGFIKVYLQT